MPSVLPMMAVCGLDCGDCDIRLLPTDAEAAQRVVAWFKEMGWLAKSEGVAEALERGMYCCGCRADRALHWSPDCWILHCCVDEKGLASCYQCQDFPCQRLSDWATQNASYAQALARLQSIQAGAS